MGENYVGFSVGFDVITGNLKLFRTVRFLGQFQDFWYELGDNIVVSLNTKPHAPHDKSERET